MSMRNTLHEISDQSDAQHSNLWYQIDAQLEEQNLMDKAKRKQKPKRHHLGWVATLVGVMLISTVAFGARSKPQYDIITMDDIAEMATPIDQSVTHDGITMTVDWAYADPNQLFVAYSVTDDEGYDLIPETYEHIMSELIIKWNDEGEYSSWGSHYQYATYGSQYIQHVAMPYNHFNAISDHDVNAPNFNERTVLNLQLRSALDNIADYLSPYKIDFDVPYGAIHYHATNNVNDDFFYNSLEEESSATSLSSKNEIMITDSGVSILMCIPLPDDISSSSIIGDSAELFVNSQSVDDTLLWRSNFSFNMAVYNNTQHDINTSGNPYCNNFIWRIAFEDLPNQLQLRIPTLAITEPFNPTETPEHLATYIDLYADLGYTVTIDSDNEPIYLANYGSDWEALYPSQQFAIERYVYQQIIEQDPPETTPYALDWDYTYDLQD